MRMLTDPYTGIQYDADKWYRGAFCCWVNKDAEAEHNRKVAERMQKRREECNARRTAAGKRKRSIGDFNRSSARFAQFLREDGGESFGEWLRRKNKENPNADSKH